MEEVSGGKALMRFTELPQALHGADARFAPLVLSWERYRLDSRRNPFFESGDGAYFLARRRGRPAGRITAHLAGPAAEGRFGFWWVDDDEQVASALIDAARSWLRERGCCSMTGPLSFTDGEEAGVQVGGHEVPGLTGRPWQPPHMAGLLAACGLEATANRPTWRLPTDEVGAPLPTSTGAPGQAGPYGDARLVLEGVAAVPDVAAALRTSGLRSAWSLAKRARTGDWRTCTVVRCDIDPATAIPAIQRAAARAGYREVIAPWSPDRRAEPEAVHRLYRLTW